MPIKPANATATETATVTDAGTPAETGTATMSTTGATTDGPVPAQTIAGPGQAFMQTVFFTIALIVLFYVLLIRPQQKRYKEHASMLGKLGVGDKIVTQGGMIGTIDAIQSDTDVLIDFGNGNKAAVLRSAIVGRYDDTVKPAKVKK